MVPTFTLLGLVKVLVSVATVATALAPAGPATRSDATPHVSRRSVFVATAAPLFLATLAPKNGACAEGPSLKKKSSEPGTTTRTKKVIVVGGDGFVGSRVCEQLTRLNVAVTSVSRTPEPPKGDWAKGVEWLRGDALTDDFAVFFKDADIVISCVGSLTGTSSDEQLNGEANAKLAEAAKAARVDTFVFVSVHPDVKQAAANVLPYYLKGKERAETEIASSFGANGVVFRPTLIYGGDVFAVNPPRVPSYWGQFVESVLSSPPFRSVADLTIAVPALHVALLPPVDVDVAATAIAKAALRGVEPSASTTQSFAEVVGTDEIRAIAASPLF